MVGCNQTDGKMMIRNLKRVSAMNFVFPAKLHEEKANIIFLVPLTVGSLIDGHLLSCIICLRDLAHVLEGSL